MNGGPGWGVRDFGIGVDSKVTLRASEWVLVSGTFTVPADVHVIQVSGLGGGAGGSGGGGGSGTGATPGGGGGGRSGMPAQFFTVSMRVVPGEVLTVVVGVGGAGALGGAGGNNAVGLDGAEGSAGTDTVITGLLETVRLTGGAANMTGPGRFGKGGTATTGGAAGVTSTNGALIGPFGGLSNTGTASGPSAGAASATGGGGGRGASGNPGAWTQALATVTETAAVTTVGALAAKYTIVFDIAGIYAVLPNVANGGNGGDRTLPGLDGDNATGYGAQGGGGGGGGGITTGGQAGNGGKGGRGGPGAVSFSYETAT